MNDASAATFENSRDRHLFGPGPKRVLALDGGGVRGALTVAFLERIEALLSERDGKEVRLGDYFDLVGGTSTGAVIADPVWRAQLESCVREACAVASAESAKVDADSVIAAMMKMPANMRSSMQKDVERGNPPELDAIAGPILRGGRRHGLEVPVTKNLVQAVEQRAGFAGSLLK